MSFKASEITCADRCSMSPPRSRASTRGRTSMSVSRPRLSVASTRAFRPASLSRVTASLRPLRSRLMSERQDDNHEYAAQQNVALCHPANPYRHAIVTDDDLRGYHCERCPATNESEHDLWLTRSEEHTSELQSLMSIAYAVF